MQDADEGSNNFVEVSEVNHLDMSEPSKELGDGMFIASTAGKEPVLFTAGTGATKTILSHKVYQTIKDGEMPSFKQLSGMRGAEGSKIR